MHTAGGFTGGRLRPSRLSLKFFFFLSLAGRAFAADLRRRGRGEYVRGRHAHDLLGDAVCLMLKRIVYRTDLELRLERSVEDCVHSGVRANGLRGRSGRSNSRDAGNMRAHGSPLQMD